jgi:hypothetical protein
MRRRQRDGIDFGSCSNIERANRYEMLRGEVTCRVMADAWVKRSLSRCSCRIHQVWPLQPGGNCAAIIFIPSAVPIWRNLPSAAFRELNTAGSQTGG